MGPAIAGVLLLTSSLAADPTGGPDLPAAAAISSAVERVLSRPEFLPPGRTLLQRLWDWIGDTIHQLLDQVLDLLNDVLERPMVSQVVLIVLTVILIALLLHLIWTILALKEPLKRGDAAPKAAPVTTLSPQPHLSEAAELAAAGRYLEASRALYLGVILWLDGTGRTRYQESKTGREYARELSGSPLVPPFRKLLGAFYPVAYGGRPAERESFEAMRSAADSMGVPA